MDISSKDIADQILEGLKQRLGDAWAERLTQTHRALCQQVAQDAADMALHAMALPQTRENQALILAEMRHINAQLANVAAIESQRLTQAFWGAAQWVVTRALAVILAAA
jgi:pyruvate kinase